MIGLLIFTTGVVVELNRGCERRLGAIGEGRTDLMAGGSKNSRCIVHCWEIVNTGYAADSWLMMATGVALAHFDDQSQIFVEDFLNDLGEFF